MDSGRIIQEALEIQSSDFSNLIKQASYLQSKSGKIGNLTITRRLVEIKPQGEALIIGDLHGDLESLALILRTSGFFEKMQRSPDAPLTFLGDYGDRGDKATEIYYLVLQLKLAFPGQVVLLRGNHEAPGRLLGQPHDLPYRFQDRFGKDGMLIYEELQRLWANLYNAAHVKNRYLMVHGGISPQINSLHDIASAEENHNEAVLEDLLWSDPVEEDLASEPSLRGAGVLFGQSVTQQVLSKLSVKILIRGHEASEIGYRINHNGRVLTLFSRKGSPYFNKFGAYLQVPLLKEFQTAHQFVSLVRQF